MFSYSVNFYCILFTNKLIREQFISFLTRKNLTLSHRGQPTNTDKRQVVGENKKQNQIEGRPITNFQK